MEFERMLSGQEQAINVGFRAETETERILSNFSPTPFELDGVIYPCVEAFWQMLKFPEGSVDRDEVARMDGRAAKKAARKAENAGLVYFNGAAIESGSDEHHALAIRAIRAKFEQNPIACELLLKTGKSLITHDLVRPDGTHLPDSKTLPKNVFCQILMQIRGELQAAETN